MAPTQPRHPSACEPNETARPATSAASNNQRSAARSTSHALGRDLTLPLDRGDGPPTPKRLIGDELRQKTDCDRRTVIRAREHARAAALFTLAVRTAPDVIQGRA